jgi:hypothetical protein
VTSTLIPRRLPVHNNVRWWVPISTQRLFGADGESEDTDTDSQVEDEGSDDTDDGVTTFDQSYVDKLRKENAARRISAKEATDRATAAEAELAKVREAEMNDLEKATAAVVKAAKDKEDAEARAVAAEARLRQTEISTAVTLAAVEANFQDPTDALSMISQDELLDEEGEISAKAVKAALAKLAKAKPYLLGTKKQSKGDGGPIGNPADQESFAAKQKAYLEQMTTTGGRVPA